MKIQIVILAYFLNYFKYQSEHVLKQENTDQQIIGFEAKIVNI